jgi:hypothetical protein
MDKPKFFDYWNPDKQLECLLKSIGIGVKMKDLNENIPAEQNKQKDIMRLTPRPLSAAERDNMDLIKQTGRDFYNFVDKLGSNRELSLAKTKIEEAVMWAVKGITG